MASQNGRLSSSQQSGPDCGYTRERGLLSIGPPAPSSLRAGLTYASCCRHLRAEVGLWEGAVRDGRCSFPFSLCFCLVRLPEAVWRVGSGPHPAFSALRSAVRYTILSSFLSGTRCRQVLSAAVSAAHRIPRHGRLASLPPFRCRCALLWGKQHSPSSAHTSPSTLPGSTRLCAPPT